MLGNQELLEAEQNAQLQRQTEALTHVFVSAMWQVFWYRFISSAKNSASEQTFLGLHVDSRCLSFFACTLYFRSGLEVRGEGQDPQGPRDPEVFILPILRPMNFSDVPMLSLQVHTGDWSRPAGLWFNGNLLLLCRSGMLVLPQSRHPIASSSITLSCL